MCDDDIVLPALKITDSQNISSLRPPPRTPLVTVVMTTYNCGKYIAMSIESIQRQTLHNWELIIIDDHSTDNTDEIVRDIAMEDDRIVYLRNACNVGCYASKNIALTHCRSEWVTFQDSDDHSMQDRLDLQIATCLDNAAECCVATYLSRTSKPRRDQKGAASLRLPSWVLAPVTLFVRCNIFFDTLGAFDSVRFGADSEILSRVILLRIPYTVLRDRCVYCCLDKWIEVSRRDSLTGSKETGSNCEMRHKYREAYTAFHKFVESSKTFLGQLRYTFPSSKRPFPIKSLTEKEKNIMFTSYDRVMNAARHGTV